MQQLKITLLVNEQDLEEVQAKVNEFARSLWSNRNVQGWWSYNIQDTTEGVITNAEVR